VGGPPLPSFEFIDYNLPPMVRPYRHWLSGLTYCHLIELYRRCKGAC
jgi:hypothetical protein